MFEQIRHLIDKAEKIALFTHVNPDGDALGSSYALKLALCGAGKECEVFLESECGAKEYAIIKGTERSGLKIEDCDLKIALDCSDRGRLGGLKDEFCGERAVIDHHITADDFCCCITKDANAAATGELIFELLREMNIPLTREIAHNLYIAISSDTGSFKYSATTPKTLEIAAKLMRTGIDFSGIARALYDTKTKEYLNMYKTAVDKLELYEDGKIALLALSASDFENAGLDETLASEIVTLPGSVAGVQLGVYIRERGDTMKISLRSNCDVDVAKIAERFGGGGHVCAAGYSSSLSLEETKAAAVAALREGLREAL